MIPCSSGDESAYGQAEEEGADANGRNGSNSANSLRGGKLKLRFKGPHNAQLLQDVGHW
jgi:hypothetical protein